MLRLIERPDPNLLVRIAGASRAIVSWNASAPAGGIALVAHRADGSVSAPLLYVRWSPDERRSLDGADLKTRIAVDVVRSEVPLSGIGIESTVPLDAIAVATPPSPRARTMRRRNAPVLDVPALSQYVPGYRHEQGWCSAASIAMLLRYHGRSAHVPEVARCVYDASYGGTGNWTFNAAYAGQRGLRAAIAYLRGLDHAAAFVAAGLPVALSIAWTRGQLPGAPLEQSDGHLVVLRGLDGAIAHVNDPAHPAVVTDYPRAELDAIFRAHGGVAYLVAPRERTAELAALANAERLTAT
ncbi:MAG TPA: C39 family peptidase [Candidatus Elarobacter sp.]